MIGGRLAIWLARHPMVAVIALLVVLGVFTATGAQLLVSPQAPPAASTRGPGLAPFTLPTPTQHPPQRRVDAAHKALHALGRACETPMLSRKPEQIRAPLDIIEEFAVDYPSGGFSMDDEPGSTLALMVVVWNALKSCDPAYVPEVERLLPAKYRGG